MIRSIALNSIADVASSPIDPSRYSEELFELHSLPAYDSGAPEVTRGLEIKSSKTLVRGADVLISKLNPRIPRVWLVAKDCPRRQIASTEFIAYRVKDSRKVDPEYLSLMLLAPQFIGELATKVRSSTGSHQRVRPADIGEMCVPVPESVEEQQRAVARIKECLERVEEIERLKCASRMQQQYLSASLIESELHPGLTSAEGWTTCAVRDLVCTVRNGRSIAQDTEGSADGAVLTLTSVRGVDLGTEYQKPIALPNDIASQFGIDAGDVFVSRANTIELVGLAAVAMEKPKGRLIYPDLLIKLKVNSSMVLPRYLAYALRSAGCRRQIKARALGSSQTMVKISGERLREVSIPVPSLRDQEAIVNRLDSAHDLMRQLVRESLPGEIEVLRSAVLRQAFAGQL